MQAKIVELETKSLALPSAPLSLSISQCLSLPVCVSLCLCLSISISLSQSLSATIPLGSSKVYMCMCVVCHVRYMTSRSARVWTWSQLLGNRRRPACRRCVGIWSLVVSFAMSSRPLSLSSPASRMKHASDSWKPDSRSAVPCTRERGVRNEGRLKVGCVCLFSHMHFISLLALILSRSYVPLVCCCKLLLAWRYSA